RLTHRRTAGTRQRLQGPPGSEHDLCDLALPCSAGGPLNNTPSTGAIGQPLARTEGEDKVAGHAPYAYEFSFREPLYLHPVLSTVARGRVTAVDASGALDLPGVRAVITHVSVDILV